jgi:hypothetical protein
LGRPGDVDRDDVVNLQVVVRDELGDRPVEQRRRDERVGLGLGQQLADDDQVVSDVEAGFESRIDIGISVFDRERRQRGNGGCGAEELSPVGRRDDALIAVCVVAKHGFSPLRTRPGCSGTRAYKRPEGPVFSILSTI